MLVVSRKLGESIYLTLPDGREIKMTVVLIDRNKVRFGIEAPQDVKILREELRCSKVNQST